MMKTLKRGYLLPMNYKEITRKVTDTFKNDKKCINKEERVQHLPGYCP